MGLTVGSLALINRPPPPPLPGVTYPSPGDTASGGQGQDVDGIKCNTTEQLTYHVHAHLSILRNGTQVLVPRYVGITNSCIYWLHTHNDTGVIHMEAPAQTTFTLKQFFDVWGYPPEC